MSELGTELRDHYEEVAPPLDTERLLDRFEDADRSRQRRRPIMVAMATALLTLPLIGAVGVMILRGEPQPDAGPTTIGSPETPPLAGEWSQALAETRARPSPPSSTCPEGVDPDVPGPVDQDRPGPSSGSNQAAVFDRHAGQIVFVDDTGETWTFDVCDNTWQRMSPALVPAELASREGMIEELLVSELVYDVDSDRTIAFGQGEVAVYDAETNTWTQRRRPAEYEWYPALAGAVYDPISGLVVVRVHREGLNPHSQRPGSREWDGLVAYDVDTDEWTVLGTVENYFLIGYAKETDRLIFLQSPGDGMVVDPRTGAVAALAEPPGGVARAYHYFGYGTGGATAYTLGDRDVCRLKPATLDWTCTPIADQVPSAMVQDPINDRLVLFNDRCCGWPGDPVANSVGALDFDTGQLTELLARPGP